MLVEEMHIKFDNSEDFAELISYYQISKLIICERRELKEPVAGGPKRERHRGYLLKESQGGAQMEREHRQYG